MDGNCLMLAIVASIKIKHAILEHLRDLYSYMGRLEMITFILNKQFIQKYNKIGIFISNVIHIYELIWK